MEKMNNMMHNNMMNEAKNHAVSDEKMETVAGGGYVYPAGTQVYYDVGSVVEAKIHGYGYWQVARITSSYYSREHGMCYCLEFGSIGADGTFTGNGKTDAVCFARLRTLG